MAEQKGTSLSVPPLFVFRHGLLCAEGLTAAGVQLAMPCPGINAPAGSRREIQGRHIG